MRRGVLVLLAALAANPVGAQDKDSHDALVAELATAESFETLLRRMLDVDMPAALLADPDVAALERDCPGAVRAMLTAATPLLSQLNDEGLQEYRTELRRLLAARLSSEDAREAAKFFASDVGRRMIRSVSAEASLGNSLDSALANEGSISRNAFERDQRSAASHGLAALSEADLAVINRDIGMSSWGAAFAALSTEITDLKYRIVNAELTPKQDAAFETVMAGAVEVHVAACDEGG